MIGEGVVVLAGGPLHGRIQHVGPESLYSAWITLVDRHRLLRYDWTEFGVAVFHEATPFEQALMQEMAEKLVPWWRRPPKLESLVAYERAQPALGLQWIADTRAPRHAIFGLTEHDLFPVGPSNPRWLPSPADAPDSYEGVIRFHAELGKNPIAAAFYNAAGKQLVAQFERLRAELIEEWSGNWEASGRVRVLR